MLNMEKLEKLAKDCGFTCCGEMTVDTLEFLPEVRDMCEANTCGMWDKSWACPPACGTLEQMREKVKSYSRGILVQTVGQMEDSFDFEVIQEAAESQNKSFQKMWDELEKDYPNLMAMGTGGCTKCKKCTYPDEPCRFPNRMCPSMEGCGLVVNAVCTKTA
ncbi:MAG: DUF2284 domain-containing protein [Oscillospiraceae bacterium]|nr:DUF2284 domain-containing protein [Oscillospiraceae bacterium]